MISDGISERKKSVKIGSLNNLNELTEHTRMQWASWRKFSSTWTLPLLLFSVFRDLSISETQSYRHEATPVWTCARCGCIKSIKTWRCTWWWSVVESREDLMKLRYQLVLMGLMKSKSPARLRLQVRWLRLIKTTIANQVWRSLFALLIIFDSFSDCAFVA